MDLSKYKDKYNVIDESNYRKSKRNLPSIQERKLVYKNSGLDQVVKDWDQLEKNVLFLRAKSKSPIELKKKYPKIDIQLLTNLISELKKHE